MEKHIVYNGISYTLHGDYYFPDLEYHTTYCKIGRWGRRRLEYLKKNHQIWLDRMMLEGTLNNHLHQIDLQCQERYDTLMEGVKRCWEITEKLNAPLAIDYAKYPRMSSRKPSWCQR